MTFEECGNTGHSGSQYPQLEEDVNYINNDNQYHPQQDQGWTQQRTNHLGNHLGNYQGNNSSNKFSPLRDLVQNQGRIMDNLSKKLASNDKILETISNKMECFSSAIKNQHGFNKMLESHICQLASFVPTANPGKIPGQPEELESANLVDIYYANLCSSKTEEGPRWTDWGMPAKRGDPGRPVITITIGAYTFKNALCDFGSSVNIMPKVLYKKINGSPLLYTTMCLQLADLSLCHPEGILDDVCLGVGRSYVVADFVVVETRGSETLSLPQPKPSSTPTTLRLSSPSMGERRDSI
jgi:hypothetical protein